MTDVMPAADDERAGADLPAEAAMASASSEAPEGADDSRLTPQEFQELAQRIESAVGEVIVGQRELVRGVLTTLLANGNALLEGVPGLGKTLLVRTLADVMEAHFSRIQFTPDLMPADIVGTQIISDDESGRRAFRFEQGPIFANLVLADEINRATPKTQSALLEAMQERSVTVGKTTYRLAEPFFVLATQNPLEMEGTYPLPEAQLDRFLFKLLVPFPSDEELAEISDRTTGPQQLQAPRVVDVPAVLEMQRLARGVPIAPHVTAHAVALVKATHPEDERAPEDVKQYVAFGASPRGVQALVIGAKIQALLEGRFNASIDDMNELAPAALRHRMVLSFEAQAEGVDPDRLVAAAVARATELRKEAV
jgi:MoxR-like ATPase